jgi:nicotinate-nucleotide--dimethylbenzimidazole phosphoribosyltransferase
MEPTLNGLLTSVNGAAKSDDAAIRRHLDSLTKPQGSLGVLEILAFRLARLYGDPTPSLRRRAVLVFASDHGVSRRGVSAYPREVTAQMCYNFARGGAAVCAIARAVDARVVVVDVGVDADLDRAGAIVHRKIRRGTADMVDGPAMSLDDAEKAMLVGAALAQKLAPDFDVFALGEMGIGNTTSAAALTCLLLDAEPNHLTGRGTGVDDSGLDNKRSVVSAAVRRVRVAHGARASDPLVALAETGGFEIAAIAGAILGAAAVHRIAVTDGFIATAAALIAVRMQPAAAEWIFASHRSTEPGHALQLAALQMRPLFDFQLRLGEGTGALLALPTLEAASALLREMATFESAGVSGQSDRRS